MEPGKKGLSKRWWVWAVGFVLVPALVFGAYKLWFSPPTQAQIDQAVSARDWPRVARLMGRADLATDRGLNYYSLGVAHTNLGNRREAISAYMSADDLGFRRADARLAIAVLYAKSGEDELALRWLRDALDAGLTDPSAVETEQAFDALRGTPEWARTLDPEGDDELSSPNALDFLIGTWNLSRGGFGTSTVTFSRIIEGRALLENWTGTAPGGASGLFVFDEGASLWSYTWVDGYGRTFVGDVRMGKQVTISGKLKFMDGMELLRRIEVRSASGVVDYIVTDSRDGGRTWDAPDQRRLTPVTSAVRPSF